MALTWTDLTADEQAEALANAEAKRAGASKVAAVFAALTQYETVRDAWRAEAQTMTEAEYTAARAVRDAEVAAAYAAYEAAQKEG